MEAIRLKPERKIQLDDYSWRHEQAPATALEGIRRGLEDIDAGRTRPAAEFLAEVRRKYGFPA